MPPPETESSAATPADPGAFWLRDQLGFALEKGPDGSGRATAAIDCDHRHLNPHGAVHGAVLFALLDTAMGAATSTTLDEGSICATIEIHTRFLAPVFIGRLTADVSVIRAGRRIVHLAGEVRDGAGTLVGHATGSFAVIGRPG